MKPEVGSMKRVQVPNIGLGSQKPLMVWFLGPESLNIGYLDPLGRVSIFGIVIIPAFKYVDPRGRALGPAAPHLFTPTCPRSLRTTLDDAAHSAP